MPARTLRFLVNTTKILDPYLLDNTPVVFKVTNLEEETAENLGFYISPAANVGDVDNPADYAPETDWLELLTWGDDTVSGVTASGGLKVTIDAVTTYISSSQGSAYKNRILFPDMLSGETKEFTVTLETPASVVSRRLFITLVLE
jgi:hypothetical protein